MDTFTVPGLDLGLNFIVAIFVKILFVLLTLLALIMVRQTSLMNKVVQVPIGGVFQVVSFVFLCVCVTLTILAMFLI